MKMAVPYLNFFLICLVTFTSSLIVSCSRGNPQMLKELCSTPEVYDIERIKNLLERGADPNGKCENDFPVLFRFAGSPKALRMLIEKGADVETEFNGQTILMQVALGDQLDSVKFLVEKGAKVNAKKRNDETALMLAARSGRPDTVKFLISKGADVNAQNTFGDTLIKYALTGHKGGSPEPNVIIVNKDTAEIIDALKKAGVKTNAIVNCEDPLWPALCTLKGIE